jgi:glutaminase
LWFYDDEWRFTYRVGLPGKSGIGGGIALFLPILSWHLVSKLNKREFRIGNACLGIIDYKTGMSVFKDGHNL